MANTRGTLKRGAQTDATDSRPNRIRKTVKTSKTATDSKATPTTPSDALVSTSSTRKLRQPKAPSCHRMKTRARDRIFPFSKLPAEIRNLVFSLAYGSDTPIDISELRLPRELKVPTLFSEGLPFFFENTPVIIPVITNWCVRHQHLHHSGYTRHELTGQVDLPRMLIDPNGISHDLVRFKHLQFQGLCCCCDGGKRILNVNAHVVKQGNTFTAEVDFEITVTASLHFMLFRLNGMGESVKAKVEEISSREGFNGFTVDDLKVLAKKFRYDPRCAKHREEDEEDEALF